MNLNFGLNMKIKVKLVEKIYISVNGQSELNKPKGEKIMNLNFGLNMKIKVKLVEKIYISVNGQSDEHDITTSPIPSKGGRLRRCITFVKDWNWILVPGIGYIIDKLSNGYLNCLVLTEMIQFIFPFTIGLLVAILWREIRNFPRHR